MTYGYTIADTADRAVFNKAVHFITEELHYSTADRLLEDVDGTLVQAFSKNGSLIQLESNVQINYVAILSDTPLQIQCLHEWTTEKTAS